MNTLLTQPFDYRLAGGHVTGVPLYVHVHVCLIII